MTARLPFKIARAHACERPSFIPVPRPRSGSKAAGLRYERRFAAFSPGSLHGAWFEYQTADGEPPITRYCQPDLIVSFLPRLLLVLEVKYTLTPEGVSKLRNLYLPVVSKAFSIPTVGAVVSHNLIPNPPPIVHSLDEAVEIGLMGVIPVLHWVGQPISSGNAAHLLLDKPKTQRQPKSKKEMSAHAVLLHHPA